ncbi:outer membrane protein assembly factor BamB [Thioflexithrix psekupsensis]|uniref:Outer membrane protein assembly factor BamB n=1 Tax=Thioflexithrix psekupsensis TaxID=1570016 RepID=A0A251X805_9GAMM|nr:outer membrane protein assembly factor BamB [Thioflexithrix psekupsensis]OUD14070.1 outer membrane protein assembly factor BamB [Thioflexithrix psekupsensis]
MLRVLIGIGLLSVLSGCGLFTQKDVTREPAPLVDFTPSVAVSGLVQWTVKASSGLKAEQFLPLKPAIFDRKIFVSDPRNGVTVFNADTGKVVWKNALKNIPVSSGPGVNQELVIVGSNKGDLIALNSTTGAEVWRTELSSEILTPPQLAQGVVVARTLDGKLWGIDSRSGQRTWVYERTVPVLTLRGASTPVLVSGAVIAGFDNGKLAAVQLDNGALLWEASIAVPRGRSELERMVDIDADPVIMGDVLYVVSYRGRMVAMDLYSGRVLWEREMSSHAGLGADNRYVYVTDDQDHVWALDRFTGSAVWKQTKLENRQLTAPVSTGQYVIVGDVEGYLHWMRAEDGQFVGRHQTDKSRILAPPILAQDRLYVYNQSGRISVLAVP